MGKGPIVRIEIIFLPLFGTAARATVHAAARHLQEHTRYMRKRYRVIH